MRHFSSILVREVTRQHGIVTIDQIRTDGFSGDRIERLRTDRILVPCQPGVLRIANAPDTFESRCVAACLADDRAVVSGSAAARLWDFDHVFETHWPEILVATPDGISPPGPLHHVTRRPVRTLVGTEVVQRGDRIRVTGRADTWFDCAHHNCDERFALLTTHVLDAHCDLGELWNAADRLCSRGRPGSARVKRVLASRKGWKRSNRLDTAA